MIRMLMRWRSRRATFLPGTSRPAPGTIGPAAGANTRKASSLEGVVVGKASHGRGHQLRPSQWREMNVFCSDGAVAIDNCQRARNETRGFTPQEQPLRRQSTWRKNGGFNPATLTSTCRRHDIDPQLYLTQPLTNIPGISSSELPHLLPDKWKRRHSPSITPKRS